ncbi:hypothetical protein GAY29_19045 [Azospirillum brasilense]|uniref:hypothetical protein n=1 Tax=Azospirillum brasilense TaxID=192 RepID=UPI00190C4ED1|nr:hypothetical protein [Azospirillum brasilense]MBK3735166.1 hypothetical protein [Azospirillum brasilense]
MADNNVFVVAKTPHNATTQSGGAVLLTYWKIRKNESACPLLLGSPSPLLFRLLIIDLDRPLLFVGGRLPDSKIGQHSYPHTPFVVDEGIAKRVIAVKA